MRFLQRMTSLRLLTMFGISDQRYGWLNYKPDPDSWLFLECIHFSDVESVGARATYSKDHGLGVGL